MSFSILSKSKAFEAPFYDSVVVPFMGAGIVTETWGNGISSLEGPNCENGVKKVVSNLNINVKN